MTNRRRLIWILVAIVVVAIPAYCGYWFYVARQLETGIDDWVRGEQQAGLAVAFERTPISGFPFAFRATFHHPHISGLVSGQRIDWQGPDVEGRVSPLDLLILDLNGPGRHYLDLGAGASVIDAAGLQVRLHFGWNGLLSSVAAEFSGLTATQPDGRSIAAGSGRIALTVPATPPRSDHDPLLGFSAEARDLKLPPDIVLLTADPLSEVQLTGTIKGPSPMAPSLQQALAAWRDQGGTVDITFFAIAQAPLSLSGSATVALDADLQPIVAANLQARGLAPTIDLLASQGRVLPAEALKLKLFVRGAEQDAPDGGKEVATGLTVQGGYLSWGPFKLARLPRIALP